MPGSWGRAQTASWLLTNTAAYPVVSRGQQDVIEYLREENRIVRKALTRIEPIVTVEVLTHAGLMRFLVFFVIDLKSRRVKIAGMAPEPDGRWMKQMARNLTDAGDGFLNETRYLIHDRDPLFTEEFRQVLRSGGVKTVKLPAQSPDLNARTGARE